MNDTTRNISQPATALGIERFPIDLEQVCENCGWRRGEHNATGDKCPDRQGHAEWRRTKFKGRKGTIV